MTHDELIEKAILAVEECGYEKDPTSAIEVIVRTTTATILTALQEPTEEMERAAFDEFEVTNPIQFKTGTHARNAIWGAMLNDSPLAGEKRGAE